MNSIPVRRFAIMIALTVRPERNNLAWIACRNVWRPMSVC